MKNKSEKDKERKTEKADIRDRTQKDFFSIFFF